MSILMLYYWYMIMLIFYLFIRIYSFSFVQFYVENAAFLLNLAHNHKN